MVNLSFKLQTDSIFIGPEYMAWRNLRQTFKNCSLAPLKWGWMVVFTVKYTITVQCRNAR